MKQTLQSALRFISEKISTPPNWSVGGALTGVLGTAIWVFGGEAIRAIFPPEPSGGTAYDDDFTPISQGGTGYALLSGAVAAFERGTDRAASWSDSRDHQLVYCRDFVEARSEELLSAFAEQFSGCLAVREMPGGSQVELRLLGQAARTYKLGEGDLRHHFCDCPAETVESAIQNLQLSEPENK